MREVLRGGRIVDVTSAADGVAFDHVILAVPDLDTAAELLERRLGLRATRGGRHPRLGTENSLVPVGGAYVELVAAVDDEAANGSVFGRGALEARTTSPRFIGWVVRTDDIESGAEPWGEVVALSRDTPDGRTVSWRMAGVHLLGAGAVPPLLSWDDAGSAPPFAEPEHPAGRVGLDHVEVGDPGGEVRAVLPSVPHVRYLDDAPQGVRAVALVADGRPLLLTPSSVTP